MRITLYLLVAIILMFLTGCAGVNEQLLSRHLEDGFNEISAATRFDPYSSRINIKDQIGKEIWTKTLRNFRVAASREGSGDGYIRFNQWGWNRFEKNEYLDLLALNTNIAGVSDLEPEWKKIALEQIAERGWAVVQSDYATGDLQHGQYRVPARVIVRPFYGGGYHGFYKEFIVHGQSEQRPAPVSIAPPRPEPVLSENRGALSQRNGDAGSGPSLQDRLIRIKKLFDAGLINQSEYDKQRTTILGDL